MTMALLTADDLFGMGEDCRCELARDIEAKILEYLDAGARLIWVFYPTTRSIRVYRPGAISGFLRMGDELSGEDVLPGFSCAVADLFPDPGQS